MSFKTATLTSANLAQSYELVNLLRGEPIPTVLRRGFGNQTPLQFMQMINFENQRFSKQFSGTPKFEIYSVGEQISNGFVGTRTVVGSTLQLTFAQPSDVEKFRVDDLVGRNFMSNSQGVVIAISGNVVTLEPAQANTPFSVNDFPEGTEVLRVGRRIRQFNTAEPSRLNVVPDDEFNYPSNIDDGGSSSYNENQKTVGIQWNADGSMFYSVQVATAIERMMLAMQHNALNSVPTPWDNNQNVRTGAKGIKYRIQFEGGAYFKNNGVANTKQDYQNAITQAYLNGASTENTIMFMGLGAREEFNTFFTDEIKYADSVVMEYGGGKANLKVQKAYLPNGLEVKIADLDLFNSRFAGTAKSTVAGYGRYTPTQMSTLIMDWSPANGYNGGSVAAVQSLIFSADNVEFRVGVKNGMIPVGSIGMQGAELTSAIDALSAVSTADLTDGTSFRIMASPRAEHLSTPEKCAYIGVNV
jgi:hypothetical protein